MEEGANRRRRLAFPEGKPAHFFKIILPTTILDKKLRVPKTFVNHHGDNFSSIITLLDPNAREWKIGLEKIEEDDDLCFSEGWENFMEYYSITDVHFLVFRYEGDSRFQVLIFDMTGSEIQYPSHKPSPERNPAALSGSPKSIDHVQHLRQNHYDNNGVDGDDEGGDHHLSQKHNDNGGGSGRNQAASSGSPMSNNHVHHTSENHKDNNGRGGSGDHQNHNDNSGGDNEVGGRNQVASSESSKSNGNDNHWSQNHNDNDVGGSGEHHEGGGSSGGRLGDSYHFTEEYFPDDEDDSCHAHEEDNFYYSISLSKSTSTSPSKSTSPAKKRRGFTKVIDPSSTRERRKHHSPPPKRKRHEHSSESESDEHSDGGSNSRRKRRRWSRSSIRGIEKKSNNHVEWIRKQTLKSKSYRKTHISERARAKVIQAADSYKPEFQFPSFRAVMRPHNLYNSIVYVPARFALKYLGEGSGKIRLENVKGKQWEARCSSKNGSGNGMSIGEGWGKFKTDNEVKEGDVCVFELVKRRDIVLRVQIFRVRQYVDR